MTEQTNTPTVGFTSHQGQRGEENDDHVAWFAIARPDRGHMVYIGVVADGVTSTSGGAQASRIATEAIEAALRDLPDSQETLTEWLDSALRSANDEILFEGKRNPEWQGMSTTVILAALAGRRLYLLHLGDSRAYLHRDGHLHQLTTDHTWAQAAVASGILSETEAAHHPGRNHLQRYLGSNRQINVSHAVLAPGNGHAEEYLAVEPGDRILLCSDGIYHRQGHATLEEIFNRRLSPQETVDTLIEAAVAQGEIDDITALIFTVPTQTDENMLSASVLQSSLHSQSADQDITVPVNQPITPPPAEQEAAKRPRFGLLAFLVLIVVLALLIFLVLIFF